MRCGCKCVFLFFFSFSFFSAGQFCDCGGKIGNGEGNEKRNEIKETVGEEICQSLEVSSIVGINNKEHNGLRKSIDVEYLSGIICGKKKYDWDVFVKRYKEASEHFRNSYVKFFTNNSKVSLEHTGVGEFYGDDERGFFKNSNYEYIGQYLDKRFNGYGFLFNKQKGYAYLGYFKEGEKSGCGVRFDKNDVTFCFYDNGKSVISLGRSGPFSLSEKGCRLWCKGDVKIRKKGNVGTIMSDLFVRCKVDGFELHGDDGVFEKICSTVLPCDKSKDCYYYEVNFFEYNGSIICFFKNEGERERYVCLCQKENGKKRGQVVNYLSFNEDYLLIKNRNSIIGDECFRMNFKCFDDTFSKGGVTSGSFFLKECFVESFVCYMGGCWDEKGKSFILTKDYNICKDNAREDSICKDGWSDTRSLKCLRDGVLYIFEAHIPDIRNIPKFVVKNSVFKYEPLLKNSVAYYPNGMVLSYDDYENATLKYEGWKIQVGSDGNYLFTKTNEDKSEVIYHLDKYSFNVILVEVNDNGDIYKIDPNTRDFVGILGIKNVKKDGNGEVCSYDYSNKNISVCSFDGLNKKYGIDEIREVLSQLIEEIYLGDENVKSVDDGNSELLLLPGGDDTMNNKDINSGNLNKINDIKDKKIKKLNEWFEKVFKKKEKNCEKSELSAPKAVNKKCIVIGMCDGKNVIGRKNDSEEREDWDNRRAVRSFEYTFSGVDLLNDGGYRNVFFRNIKSGMDFFEQLNRNNQCKSCVEIVEEYIAGLQWCKYVERGRKIGYNSFEMRINDRLRLYFLKRGGNSYEIIPSIKHLPTKKGQ